MRKAVNGVAVGFALTLVLVSATAAQTVADSRPKASEKPVTEGHESIGPMKEYRKVGSGMSEDEVESVLGEPKVKDERGFLYDLSDSETVQIEVGPKNKVIAIAVMFEEGKGAPSLTDVFGPGATADPNQNGSVYKMVRYKDAGLWVSYYSGPGNKSATTITIRKL